MTPSAEDGAEEVASPDAELPGELTSRLNDLDEESLRAVIVYAQSLLPSPPTVTDLLAERAEDDLVEIIEHEGYTTVKKMQPCAEGCEDCPHGPYLYRVRAERSPEDGAPSLRWDFLGRVNE
ncbi:MULTISPECIES: hypothetical protein [Halorussus]|uniref:hypothetical protein n=1 Tax=Halorussus TaxID=1070314 RepID=UPI00209CB74B|nr:hypothetical protein [Halorussus vallis]USZ76016.1 hypothetical protein NGM07_01525 [Halorussus vallis]